MNENYQFPGKEQLIGSIQPKKIVEHFGGDINEIKQWADLSSPQELLYSIKAFELEGLQDYAKVLKESLLLRSNVNKSL